MKNTALILILLLFTVSCSTTKSINNSNKNVNSKLKDTIALKVNLNKMSRSIKETLDKGNYNLNIYGEFEKDKYLINYSKNESVSVIDPIKIESDDSETEEKIQTFDTPDKDIFTQNFKFRIKNRSKFEVNLDITDKDKKDSIIQKYKILYSSKINKKWVTSFGVSSIFQKSDTYKTMKHSDSTYQIVRDGNNQRLLVVPLMQFSYIDTEKDDGFAFSGGIGFDTENISVFAGGSYFVGQNIFLTGGLSLHKQKKLSNLYSENQIISNSIDQSELNKDYYRINPFISITYRLSKNIFK